MGHDRSAPGPLDVSQSTAHLNPNHTWTSLDVDTGYGPNTNNGINGYTGGVAVTGDDKTLPYWTAYGPNTVAGTPGAQSANVSGSNPFIIGSHVLPIQEQINTDKVNQAKIEATWHTGDTSITGGVQFVQDVWDAQELDTFTNNEWQLWSGYGPTSNNVTDAGIVHGVNPAVEPVHARTRSTTFIHGYNCGNLPPGLTLYNPYAVLNYLITQPINADYAPNSGYGPYTGGYPTPVLSTGSVQHVDRKNYAPFVGSGAYLRARRRHEPQGECGNALSEDARPHRRPGGTVAEPRPAAGRRDGVCLQSRARHSPSRRPTRTATSCRRWT